jgi:hypothetical protein
MFNKRVHLLVKRILILVGGQLHALAALTMVRSHDIIE